MNRALKRISLAVLAMFLLLLVNINYLQGFETASLASEPGNSRALAAQFQYQRGDIVTSDGVKIAGTTPSNDEFNYQRVYLDPQVYAPVTGYDSIFSATGVEQAENGVLSGTGSSLSFRNFIDMITNKPRKGATVELTVNSKVQQAAYSGLQGILQGTNRTGGAVAINPKTGAILAMASWPSYNTNLLAVHDGTQLNKNDAALLHENPSPLVNNATASSYPPGSTFKIVTSSAWFDQDATRNPNTTVQSPTQLVLPQTTHVLTNDDDEVCGGPGNTSGKTSLLTAFAQSCDTTFGQLGMDVGSNALDATAQAFGFNNSSMSIPGVTTIAPSDYIQPPSEALTAFSAIGQFSDTVTPLQEAMLAATVANNGTLMRPYLVQQVTASDLSVVDSTAPSVLATPVSPKVAGYLKQMMIAVVQSPIGTANAFNQSVEGVQIAGKTGTAQNGANNSNLDDAVFTAFAPADNPTIAVGVIVKGGGFGAAAAAPIAVSMIKAALGIG